MTFSVNNNLNNNYYNNPPVNMQGIEDEKKKAEMAVKKQVASNPVSNKVGEDSTDPKALLLTMLPIWLGLGFVMDKFNAKCGGKYEDSLVGKVGAKLDKVGNNKIFQSDAVKKTGNVFSKIKGWFNKNIVNKSKVLSAFAHTPTAPEFSMVKTMSRGTIAELANDATQITKEYLKQPIDWKTLVDPNKTKAIAKLEALEKADPKKFAQIVEKLKLKSIGLNSKTWAKIEKDAVNNVDDIIKAFSGVEKQVSIWKKTPVIGRFVGRDVKFSAVANKLQALKGGANIKQTTALGKTGTKGFLRLTEGLTNGTAGGKMVILMQAWIFADAFLRAAKAPKGEKVSTFMESVTSDVGMYLMIPYNIQLLHKFGGLKYTGMSTSQVAHYRGELAKFNEKATSGVFKSNKEYKTAKKSLDGLLKGTSKWYHKPFKAFGKFVSVGLEKIKPYKSAEPAAKWTTNLLRKGKYLLKEGAGWPVRFLGVALVIAPFFSKIFTKASHAIFGRPTKSILDKEEAPKEKAGPMTPQEPVVQFEKPDAQNANPQPVKQQQSQQPAIQPVVNPTQPSPQNENAQAGSNPFGPTLIDKYSNNTNQQNLEPKRSYIPSSAPVIVQQNSGQDKVSDAMRRADFAEQEAMKILGN